MASLSCQAAADDTDKSLRSGATAGPAAQDSQTLGMDPPEEYLGPCAEVGGPATGSGLITSFYNDHLDTQWQVVIAKEATEMSVPHDLLELRSLLHQETVPRLPTP